MKLLPRFLHPLPIARGGVEAGQGPFLRHVEKIVVPLEKPLHHAVDIAFAGDGHIQEAAGCQQPAHLVQGGLHGFQVVTGEGSLQKIAGDFQFTTETSQHLPQKAEAQGAAVLTAHPAGKLQGKIILIGIGSHQGVEIGIMVAEFGAYIGVFS